VRAEAPCIAVGVVAATATPGFILAVADLFEHGASFAGFIGPMVLGFVFAFPFAFFLGLPIFLLLCWMHLVKWWSAIPAGLLVGVLADRTFHSVEGFNPNEILRFGLMGGASATSFWLIWRRSQMDSK
jgi:hypothetical protein